MKQSGPAAKVRQSLNLGGDGDELQLLDDLERTFAVKFDYKELGYVLTVGNLENAVWNRLAESTGDKCINAMAFFELRRLMRMHALGNRISPTDSVAKFADSARTFAALLKRETGMRFEYRHTRVGHVGAYLQWAWPAAIGMQLFGFGRLALMTLGFAVIGLVLMRVDKGLFIDRQTVGDVAKLLATQRYGFFARKGGRVSKSEVVEKARAVIADFQGFEAGEIGPDTVLISKRYSVFLRR